MIQIDKLLYSMDAYIKESARCAADTFAKERISIGAFEGISIELTSKMCEEIYKDLIVDIVKNRISGSSKYSLMVFMIPIGPVQPDGRLPTKFRLGMMFPDA